MTRPRYSRLLPWGVVLGLALSLLAAWAYGQSPSCASVYVPRSNCARLFRDWGHMGDVQLFAIDRSKPGLPTGERWHLHERDAATGQVVNFIPGCDAERTFQPVCTDPFYAAVGGPCRLETSADYDALVDYLMSIVAATRDSEMLDLGVSPRGSLALFRAAQALALTEERVYCIPDDIKRLVLPVFAHRILVSSRFASALRRSEEAEAVLTEIMKTVSVPL